MIMIKVTISGCTGFSNRYSRKILWLEVGPSNNNPAIVAKYFVDALGVVEGAPRIVRLDLGTENTSLAVIQGVLRMDCRDALRIECWWSFLRKPDADWWISFFTGMLTILFYGTNSKGASQSCPPLESSSY